MFWLTPQTQACQIHHRGGGLSNNELLLSNTNKPLLLAQNSSENRSAFTNSAENSAQINTYQLGAVEVTAPKEVDYNPSVSTITAKNIKDINADNIAQALRTTPGVLFVENHEQFVIPTLRIRGNNYDTIGVYLDGIPINDNYDGRTDYSQYATQGIASIQVSKGFTSPMYGVNQMGGVINIVSAKPQKEFEFSVRGKWLSQDEIQSGVSVGTNQGFYYLGADYSLTDRTAYPLSRDYKGSTLLPAGESRNAYMKSQTIKLKIGFTPNENHEYALNYIYRKAKKGSPIGESSGNWWEFPIFDKQTFYLVGNSFFTPNLSLNTRLYYDIIDIQTLTYGAATATTPTNVVFKRDFNDDIMGAILTLNYDIAQSSNLKFGFNVKQNHHKGLFDAEYDDIKELTSSVFAQFAQRLGDFRVVLAGNYDRSDMLDVYVRTSTRQGTNQKTNTDKDSLGGDFSAQGALYYNISDGQTAHLVVARKHNMPNLWRRYFYVHGNYIPNPKLKPETAMVYELGYDLNLASTTLNAAIFYSDIDNLITSQRIAENTCISGNNRNQYLNAPKSYSYGGEIGIEQALLENALVLGLSYTYTQKKLKGLLINNTSGGQAIRSNKAGSKITGYPNHILNAKLNVKPNEQVEFVGLAQYQSPQWYDKCPTGLQPGGECDGYEKSRDVFSFDISANYAYSRHLTLNAGVLNLTDRDNVLTENKYHFAGRRYMLGFDYKY